MTAEVAALASSPGRRRSTILAAIEAFMARDPGITLNSVLVFLYTAENQGLTISELAAVAGLSKPTASRCIRSLAARGSPGALAPYLGLVEIHSGVVARNSKTVTLSRAGLELCGELERCIGDRVFIEAAPPAEAPGCSSSMETIPTRPGIFAAPEAGLEETAA